MVMVSQIGGIFMKCSNCNEEMKMDYEMKVHGASLLAYISLKKDKDEKQIKAAVCPKCGKIEFYTA
jgi:DNA-directed RNA polymerase subunit M/transcription elongation factor TFIIS